jgi:RimJ/RimL family protein N-acetyltransferase
MKTDHSDVELHRTDESDLPELVSLWNDGRVMRWVGFPQGLGYDNEKALRWLAQLESNPLRHHFVIRGEKFDFAGELYYEVDRCHRMVSLDIKLTPEAQGQGIATQAFRALIDIVFKSESEIDSVWVEPWPENIAAQNLYSRCGLKPQPRPKHLGKGPSFWQLRRMAWRRGWKQLAAANH